MCTPFCIFRGHLVRILKMLIEIWFHYNVNDYEGVTAIQKKYHIISIERVFPFLRQEGWIIQWIICRFLIEETLKWILDAAPLHDKSNALTFMNNSEFGWKKILKNQFLNWNFPTNNDPKFNSFLFQLRILTRLCEKYM